jgi:hypothetical protein
MKLFELNKRIKEVFVGCIAEDSYAIGAGNRNRFCRVTRINGNECFGIWYEDFGNAVNGICPNESYEMWCELRRMKLVVE